MRHINRFNGSLDYKAFFRDKIDWKFYNYLLNYITIVNDTAKDGDTMDFLVSCGGWIFLSDKGYIDVGDLKNYWGKLIDYIKTNDANLIFTIREGHNRDVNSGFARFGREKHFADISKKAESMGYLSYNNVGFLTVEMPLKKI